MPVISCCDIVIDVHHVQINILFIESGLVHKKRSSSLNLKIRNNLESSKWIRSRSFSLLKRQFSKKVYYYIDM